MPTSKSSLHPHAENTSLVLSNEAIAFVAELQRTFGRTIAELMVRRAKRQQLLDAGEERFDFLPETKHIRDGNWTCAETPRDIRDRRVEITGPIDKKMIINALNSGASVFMADFEDATTPTWSNIMDGQKNLYDAVRRTLTFETPEKKYEIGKTPAVLNSSAITLACISQKKHFCRSAESCAAHRRFRPVFLRTTPRRALFSLKDGCSYHLPKLESHLEARLRVRRACRRGVSHLTRHSASHRGTIWATVHRDAAGSCFEMNEIHYELREPRRGSTAGAGITSPDFTGARSSAPTARQSLFLTAPAVTVDALVRDSLNAYSRLLVEELL